MNEKTTIRFVLTGVKYSQSDLGKHYKTFCGLYMEQRMDRWHGPGTSNTQPLLNTKHTINNMNSEYYIEDGSFFRIRNVQLAYNFDKTLISRIGMQALKLYVNIQNLKTWKHNTGYTPELGGTAIAFGVDDGSYPMPAIYTFGFNLTF